MLRLGQLNIVESFEVLKTIPDGKVLINTINAYSYCIAQKDDIYKESLSKCDYLLPDGMSILWGCKWLNGKSIPKERIAGWNLFSFEMEKLERKCKNLNVNNEKLRVMFMGSSEKVLRLIQRRCCIDYPNLDVVMYSPPYRESFSEEDSRAMINTINEAKPDLLWIGMTAPKQEKWTWLHWDELQINCHVGTIGAVFDFYAGTARRAPLWWQEHGLEWLYRLLKEPKRMWRRYLVGNPLFIWNIIKEKYGKKE